MFTRIGAAAFKKDLTNTIALCKVLGDPQTKFKTIHIAGTNGKGSTSHMLASVLQEAGYKTGLYTSPHLKDFRERIRINGEMMSEQEVVDFVARYQPQFDSIEPSFFEWTVALCFHHFAQQKVDVAVVETGLGGRLDSTNIITPLLSVITNIGWDHMDMLGNNLEAIAEEKAGIIKTGIPVVIGETQAETTPVFLTHSRNKKAPLHFADQVCAITEFQPILDGLICQFQSPSIQLEDLYCDLGGLYQEHNLKTVITTIEELRQLGFNITDQHIRDGLAKVKANTGLMGRWQVLNKQPLTVCDTGHNSNGLAYVIKQIDLQPYDRLHIVLGMVRDKDISKLLSMLPKTALYYFCNAAIPRALPAEELQQQAAAAGLKGVCIPNVAGALRAAQQQAQPNDMIFIGGSTFVVAEIV